LVQQSHLSLQYQGTQVSLHPYSLSTLQTRERHILCRQPHVRNVLCKHVRISHWHMNTWRMLKMKSSNFLMMRVTVTHPHSHSRWSIQLNKRIYNGTCTNMMCSQCLGGIWRKMNSIFQSRMCEKFETWTKRYLCKRHSEPLHFSTS
jgi:hypothetical protein